MFQGVGPVSLLDSIPVRFECKCSRERALRTLSTLGQEDLLKLAGEQENTEVRCHFCNEVYPFGASEIRTYASTLRDEGQ